MRSSVSQPFFDYTRLKEGYTPFPYADRLNLVTTGMGFLIDGGRPNGIDTSAQAMQTGTLDPLLLAWYHRAPGWTSSRPLIGAPATGSEVSAAWIAVKSQDIATDGTLKPLAQSLRAKGGFAYVNVTDLTLSDQGIQDAFNKLASGFENTLRRYFPNWDQWPADAQFATMSMAWAMGPSFPVTFVQFTAAANALDFATAATQSFFNGGGGIPSAPTGRNADNKRMFLNAAAVIANSGNRDTLFFQVGPAISPGLSSSQSMGLWPWIGVLGVTGGIFVGTLKMKGRR